MDRAFGMIAREIARAGARLAAIDWRAVLYQGAILAALLGRGAECPLMAISGHHDT